MNPIKPWKVVDLTYLGSSDRDMEFESSNFIAKHCSPNGCGQYYLVGSDEDMPHINKWLLTHDFKEGEPVLFWISW